MRKNELESLLTELRRSEIEEATIRFVLSEEEYGYIRFCPCCEHVGDEDFLQINLEEDLMPESLLHYMTDYDEAFCIPVDEFVDAFDGKVMEYKINAY